MIDADKLRKDIQEANESYRIGNPVMSDAEYDGLLDELRDIDSEDPLLYQVGYAVGNRESKLPIPMFSLDKKKAIDALMMWAASNGLSMTTMMCLTGKYDGIAIVCDEDTREAWTRGDGEVGQKSTGHFAYMNKGEGGVLADCYSYGEAIMLRDKFKLYHSGAKEAFMSDGGTPKNARNFVAGKFNADVPCVEVFKDIDYIRYGCIPKEGHKQSKSKVFLLSQLNYVNPVPVAYHHMLLGEITEEIIVELFNKWKKDYCIDGIVIEVDDLELAEKIGRGDGGNPNYAVAYKGDFEEEAETKTNCVEYQVSKQGYLKPVACVDGVELDGVTVSRVTLYNAKNVKDSGIGTDAIVRVKRSGMVIPKIIEVVEPVEFEEPEECPECGSTVAWNDSGVEIVCMDAALGNCWGANLMRAVAFFDILGVDDVGEGVIRRLFDSGYDDISKIIALTNSDMMEIEGFGELKAKKVCEAISDKLASIPRARLQHASGCFEGLGESTFEIINAALLEDKSLGGIEGIGDVTIKSFDDGVDKFNHFIGGILDYITISDPVITSNDMADWVVVMTGFRDKDLEARIKTNGGRISSSVSGNTTHLVCKAKGSGSPKENKAKVHGINIYNKDEFIALIG